MKKYLLALIFILISNSILYSQITGISRSQKQEITKGLKAGEEYKKIILERDSTVSSYKRLVLLQDSTIKSKDNRLLEKDGLIELHKQTEVADKMKIQSLQEENLSLYRKLKLGKVVTIGLLIVSGFLSIR